MEINESAIKGLIDQLNQSVISMLNEISFIGISEQGYTAIKTQIEIIKVIIQGLENELTESKP